MNPQLSESGSYVSVNGGECRVYGQVCNCAYCIFTFVSAFGGKDYSVLQQFNRCSSKIGHPLNRKEQSKISFLCFLCGTRLLSATRPSKLINGCQGHPLFCLSPGTAQRQRNPEEKRMNAQSLYSVGICRQSRYAV